MQSRWPTNSEKDIVNKLASYLHAEKSFSTIIVQFWCETHLLEKQLILHRNGCWVIGAFKTKGMAWFSLTYLWQAQHNVNALQRLWRDTQRNPLFNRIPPQRYSITCICATGFPLLSDLNSSRAETQTRVQLTLQQSILNPPSDPSTLPSS